uniref:Uncharacterized protein n=1 Tax=Aegilops tauschii subsp. strangulata TaxID=200361 RepID=A0A453I9W7_AEGTS
MAPLGVKEQGRAKRPAVWGGAARPAAQTADASWDGGEASDREGSESSWSAGKVKSRRLKMVRTGGAQVMSRVVMPPCIP